MVYKGLEIRRMVGFALVRLILLINVRICSNRSPTPLIPRCDPYSAASRPPNVFSEAYRTYRKPERSAQPLGMRPQLCQDTPSSSLDSQFGSGSTARKRDSLVLIVDGAHESSSRWEDIVDKDEDRLLRSELDTFSAGSELGSEDHEDVSPDNVYELSDSQVLTSFSSGHRCDHL